VKGWGVPVDYNAAREWLSKSAAAGDRLGMYNFAFILERGLGGPPDLAVAISMYERSAAAGYDDAKEALRRLNVR
jgi:TPR repeat protein